KSKQEVAGERDGILNFVGTPLKKGEEKTLPPERIFTATNYYLAVEVAYNKSDPSTKFALAGDPDKGKFLKVDMNDCFRLEQDDNAPVWTRWKEGMPLYPTHVKLLTEDLKYRKLEHEETVKAGQFLGQIDAKVALGDLRVKLDALDAAEADRFA